MREIHGEMGKGITEKGLRRLRLIRSEVIRNSHLVTCRLVVYDDTTWHWSPFHSD
jgi:hypothetical protein